MAHFVAGHSAECTVCLINDKPAPRQAETFLHMFYECYFTSRYRQMAESDFFPEISALAESEKRAFWLLGIIPTNIGYICNQFIQSAVLCINYMIWKIKLSKSRTPVSIFREDFVFMCRNLLSKSGKLREVKTNSHFFCAGKISEMASQQDAMDTDSREAGLIAAFETEADDPEARLRRRERREALKQAAREEEEDESLLDETDGDENDGPTGETAAAAEMLQEPRVVADPPALQLVQAAPPLPPPPPAQAAVTPTPTEDDIGTGKDILNNKKNPIRQKVELKFVNCGSKANPSGAGEQLRINPVNLSGTGQAEPNPRGGSGLFGHSDSASSIFLCCRSQKKFSNKSQHNERGEG